MGEKKNSHRFLVETPDGLHLTNIGVDEMIILNEILMEEDGSL
jgi:hypothetical protein